MHGLKGVNFDGYPGYDIDTLFDRLEAAKVTNVSPFGIEIEGMTKEEFDLWKAVFGRNNGYPITDQIPMLPYPKSWDSDDGTFKMQSPPPPKPTFWQRVKNAYRAFRGI